MNELSVLNIATSLIGDKLISLGYDLTNVNWPNATKDQSENDEYIEVSLINYMSKSITLGMSTRVLGCITISVFARRDVGVASATTLCQSIAESLSAKIIDGIVFSPYDLRTLDHTLSQRQTTTPIPRFQVNCNIDFSFTR